MTASIEAMARTIEDAAASVGILRGRGNIMTSGNRDGVTLDALTRFAALVRAQALEEAASVAESTICDVHLPTGVRIYGTKAAAAIRALPPLG